MSKIKILPEILSNKIAAGEVVERPASVVKELVENTLDAGSSVITIEIEQGGKSLIRVSDNGCGMAHDDALLSLERFATSKISDDSHLFAVKTLGFRGEALPSIASVSRFSMISRHETRQTGTQIFVHSGKIKKVSETGAPKGTMITVQDLFVNTPARRKFLKSVNTEIAHISDTISSIALGRPDVKFRLTHNKKIIKNWSIASAPVQRVLDVLGTGLQNDLYEVKFKDTFVSVSGWVGSPKLARSGSRAIYIYVNGRFVRDKIIRHALFSGYEGRIVKGRFPVAVLFINVPFDRVDVNVHPAKNEVRFADQNKVHDAVARAVLHGVKSADYRSRNTDQIHEDQRPCIAESVKTYEPSPEPDKPVYPHKISGINPNNFNKTDWPQKSDTSQLKPDQVKLWRKGRFSDLKVMGQFHNTYIICESQNEIIFIDQHAAHERILYEQLKNHSETLRLGSQQLLVPETIELNYTEAVIIQKLIPGFNEYGLEIEPFGGNTFVVKTVPAVFSGKDIKSMIMELIDKMAETGISQQPGKPADQCLMVMACHGAIRANQRLSDKQMKNLLARLDLCDNPSNCPHGRPTWISYDMQHMEKAFRRIA